MVSTPDHLLATGHGIGYAKGHFLGCRAPGLAIIIAGIADGVPPGDEFHAVLDGVDAQLEGRLRRQHSRRNSDRRLQQKVILARARQFFKGNAPVPGVGKIHGLERDIADGLAADQGNADVIYRDAVEENLHVLDRVDGHAAAAHVGPGLGIIAVVAAERRIIVDAVYACGTLLEKKLVPLVRFFRRSETGELSVRPSPAPIHGRVNPADVGGLPGKSQVPQVFHVGHMLRRVERLYGNSRERPERFVKFLFAAVTFGTPGLRSVFDFLDLPVAHGNPLLIF